MTEPKKKIPVFKVIFLLVGLIGIVVAGLAALGPKKTEVERSIYLNSKQQDVYEYLLNLEEYHNWQVAIDYDSAMTYQVEGPKAEGGKYHWSGNELVGEGFLEITKADPFRFIEMQLQYLKPWEALATYRFNLTTEDGGTKVTWGYEAKNAFFNRISLLFMNMDKLLGGEMENGLSRMQQRFNQSDEKKKTQ